MRVLIVSHGFPPRAQGGSEIYAEAHARTLHSDFGDEVVVLTRENDLGRPEYCVRETDHDGIRVVWVNNTFRSVRSFEESYTNPAIAAVAERLIAEVRPEAAHLHHLTCLSTLIPARLREAGVPCVATLHDYWLLCHRGQLLDLDGRICDRPCEDCSRCVGAAAGAPAPLAAAASVVRALESSLPAPARHLLRAVGGRTAGALTSDARQSATVTRRARHMRDVAAQITHFFAPSAHLRQRFIASGFDESRISLSSYGFDHSLLSGARTPRSGALRLGFVGSLMFSKAPHILLEAAARLPAGSVRVDLFGAYVPFHGDDSYRATLAPLLDAPHVTVHGSVPHEEMRRVFGSMDVLVVPSIWPENSPLVIHEAFLAGVPVVASRLGGIPELVRDGENGLLFSAGSVDELRACLARVSGNPDVLDRLSRHAPSVRTIQDAAAAYRRAYAAATTSRQAQTGGNRPRVHAVVLNYRTPDATLLAVRSLLASRQSLASVTVVDNSEDASCGRALAGLSDRVDYISTESNLGFSGGMNVGLRRALASGATHMLLVNSDMTVPPDCIGTMLDALGANPNAGIAGPVVLARSAPDRIASRGLDYHDRWGRMRHRHFDERVAAPGFRSEAVSAVSGCLMLIERRVLERVGLLDEAYFFGFEDLDFCLRARSDGFSPIVTPAIAYHEGGQSLPASSSDRLYYAARNHLRLANRRDGRGGVVAATRSLSIVGLNVAFALKAPPGRVTGRLMAVARGVRDYRRGRFGPLEQAR